MTEPARNRTRRSLTMSDESWEKLTGQAEAAGMNRSRFMEYLVTRRSISLSDELWDRLAAYAEAAGVSHTQFIEDIITRRSIDITDESWGWLTARAAAVGMNRDQFLEQLILTADRILAGHPLPPRPWWKFWAPERAQPITFPLTNLLTNAKSDGQQRGMHDAQQGYFPRLVGKFRAARH